MQRLSRENVIGILHKHNFGGNKSKGLLNFAFSSGGLLRSIRCVLHLIEWIVKPLSTQKIAQHSFK